MKEFASTFTYFLLQCFLILFSQLRYRSLLREDYIPIGATSDSMEKLGVGTSEQGGDSD